MQGNPGGKLVLFINQLDSDTKNPARVTLKLFEDNKLDVLEWTRQSKYLNRSRSQASNSLTRKNAQA